MKCNLQVTAVLRGITPAKVFKGIKGSDSDLNEWQTSYESFCCSVQSNLTFQMFKHSHKKRKDSLETLTVLLIFLLELEISGVTIQGIH